jgi:preprotein translocase subunit SecA
MLKGIAKLLGGSTEKVLKELSSTVDEINGLEPEIERLSDDGLRAKTGELRSALRDGEELDDLLPEAFAAVREAAKRTLGQRHFDVQLIGGIVLHQGKIAEMRTGEGKTLVATLAAYLNALSGDGVHVVTVNDYLARRDAQWMAAIYHKLGLSVGVLQHQSAYLYDPDAEGDQSMEQLTAISRRDAYEADITYGTNNEFGFDYLKDNMMLSLDQRVQRGRSYAIVDEVDNILIDEARTPLIISGPAEESGKEYYSFSKLVPGLQLEEDFTIDEKHRSVSLTVEGMAKIEKMLNVDNLYGTENFKQVHFVENALKAHAIYQKDREYVVKDREVIIVDEFTGRLMPGRRYSDGLHQALEAKEGLSIQRETVTYATITLQNYFRLYTKLAGMTGTAATEAEEFWKIYKLDVVEAPTNLPMLREDMNDLIYRDQNAKYEAVVDDIRERHSTGQPVLVGTTDISKSELLSDLLTRRNIPHEVLNAKQHDREAPIVAEAGRAGAVTVATNMAGRGTDIVLGGNPEALGISPEHWEADHKKVVELGGLHIIGTERHEARRIDNQLRGRAGRQGDPGGSRFYVALDDDLMKRFGGEKIQTVMGWAGLGEGDAIENKMISRSIEGSQVKVEAYHFDARKYLVEYDDVINTQRDVIYGEREKVLGGADLQENIRSMIEREISDIVARVTDGTPPEMWDVEALVGEMEAVLPLDGELADPDVVAQMDPNEMERRYLEYAEEAYREREQALTEPLVRTIEREVTLRVIDSLWVQHLTNVESLRQGIGLQAYGQRDPLVSYKREGREMFQSLLDRIEYDLVHSIYHLMLSARIQTRDGKSNGATARQARSEKSVMTRVVGDGSSSREPVPAGTGKIGRNEPCFCGSDKKYKRCHGA